MGCPISAKCKRFWTQDANLPDTPADLTCASKLFQTLPGPPGGKYSTFRSCKRMLMSTGMHPQLSKCIWDATIFDQQVSYFWSSLDLCAGKWETTRAAKISCGWVRVTSRTGDETSVQLCARLYTWCCILIVVLFKVP